VLLISKESTASQPLARGAAAVTAEELTRPRKNTLKGGCGLGDPEAVELLVRQAPACCGGLLASSGMAFDRSTEV